MIQNLSSAITTTKYRNHCYRCYLRFKAHDFFKFIPSLIVEKCCLQLSVMTFDFNATLVRSIISEFKFKISEYFETLCSFSEALHIRVEIETTKDKRITANFIVDKALARLFATIFCFRLNRKKNLSQKGLTEIPINEVYRFLTHNCWQL